MSTYILERLEGDEWIAVWQSTDPFKVASHRGLAQVADPNHEYRTRRTYDLFPRITSATISADLPECIQCLKLAGIRIRKQETTIRALAQEIERLHECLGPRGLVVITIGDTSHYVSESVATHIAELEVERDDIREKTIEECAQAADDAAGLDNTGSAALAAEFIRALAKEE